MIRSACLLLLLLLAGFSPAQAQDTAIAMGTIIVAKQPIAPYYKVEYEMRRIADPAKTVKKVRTPATDSTSGETEQFASTDGSSEWTRRSGNPGGDSLGLEKGTRLVFPKTNLLLSRHYADDVNFFYSRSDTPRVDTIRVGLWINKQGAVKRVYIRQSNAEETPQDLYDQVVGASLKLKKWGEPGGYWPRKRLFRKSVFVKDNFYCDMYIIVASYPMSAEQLISGSRYMNTDRIRNLKATEVEPRKKKKEKKVVTEQIDGVEG
jgi:hypothetical protein